MKIHYEFIENHNLLIQKAVGKWCTQYYINYIKTTLNDERMLHVKKVFSDLRDVDLAEAFKDLDLLIDLRKSMINLNYINVNIVSTPTSSVVSHLYQDKVAQMGSHNHHYCSTVKTALALLQLPMSEDEMEALLIKIVK